MSIFKIIIITLIYNQFSTEVAEEKRFLLPGYVFQYAGSAGLASGGVFFRTKNNIELGLAYGFTPQAAGSHLHTLTLKLSFHLKKISLSDRVSFSPVMLGSFVSLSFNKNLSFKWEKIYPKDYYWWQRNFRQHIFIGSQLDMTVKKVSRSLAIYFEANTNDLYLLSFLSNPKTISVFDIFFFGAGIKFYGK